MMSWANLKWSSKGDDSMDEEPMPQVLMNNLARDKVLNETLYQFDKLNEFQLDGNKNIEILDKFMKWNVDKKKTENIGLNLLSMSKKWTPQLKFNQIFHNKTESLIWKYKEEAFAYY